ncbi:MAG: SAM-dependent methyltransferase [Lactobacillaceae bacterium]|jgi:hypothetical protein|nr:SAM-dependent methyltransferase [Lactobacillaceae bacterium]
MTNHQIRFGAERQLAGDEYLSELLHYQQLYQAVPTIETLLADAIKVIQSLHAGYLPPLLPVLELPETVVAEVAEYVLAKYPKQQSAGNRLWQKLTEPLEEVDYLLRHLRDKLISDYSMYGYVSDTWVRDLASYLAGAPVLELMAGHGYISAGLRELDYEQKIIATDNLAWLDQPDLQTAQPVTAIENLDALAALDKYGAQVQFVLLSWAPDTTEADWEVLHYIRDNQARFNFELIVIGEKDGATNSAKFWQDARLTEIASLNVHHQSFDLIDERVYLVQ